MSLRTCIICIAGGSRLLTYFSFKKYLMNETLDSFYLLNSLLPNAVFLNLVLGGPNKARCVRIFPVNPSPSQEDIRSPLMTSHQGRANTALPATSMRPKGTDLGGGAIDIERCP